MSPSSTSDYPRTLLSLLLLLLLASWLIFSSSRRTLVRLISIQLSLPFELRAKCFDNEQSVKVKVYLGIFLCWGFLVEHVTSAPVTGGDFAPIIHFDRRYIIFPIPTWLWIVLFLVRPNSMVTIQRVFLSRIIDQMDEDDLECLWRDYYTGQNRSIKA